MFKFNLIHKYSFELVAYRLSSMSYLLENYQSLMKLIHNLPLYAGDGRRTFCSWINKIFQLIEVDLKTVDIFKRNLRNVYRDINPLLPSAAYMRRRAKILILI